MTEDEYPALDKAYDEVVGLQKLWQSLQSLQSLEVTFLDYREVRIKEDSVIYCDPPYKGTDGYEHGDNSLVFDHEDFYDWCENQSELVLVSEYSMPEDRFVEVWRTGHRSTLGSTSNNAVTERLFVSKKQKDRYDYLMSRSIKRCVQLSLF